MACFRANGIGFDDLGKGRDFLIVDLTKHLVDRAVFASGVILACL
jgi:hypothetical protein